MGDRRLRLLALGGTIAMSPVTRGGAGQGEGVVPGHDAAELIRAVPALAGVGRIEAVDLRRVASANLTIRDALRLVDEIFRAAEEGVDGVLVTQGTDTLEEMAFLLHCLFGRPPVPVVLTGAMRPPGAPGADGPANLLAAARAAATPACRELGVLVAMNDRFHGAIHVAKRHSCAPDAFGSGDVGVLALHCEGRVGILARPPSAPHALLGEAERRRLADCESLPHVAIAEALFDAPADLALAGLDGAQGAVLAAFGAGHVPERWADALEDFARLHPLVLASRTGGGPVLAATYAYRGGEIDLLARGLIPAGWLTPAKARLALLLLLGSGVEGEDLRNRFRRIAGGLRPTR